jgi:DNA processing protein
MIREQSTVLVSRPDEVVELVGELGADAPLPLAVPARPTDGLGSEAASVHEAMPARGPVTVAQLLAATGLQVPVVVRALGELAAAGLVDGDGDTWRRSRPAARRTHA